MADKVYGPEYSRGYEDGFRGAAPDYGQERTEDLLDYIDGYRAGLRAAWKETEPVEEVQCPHD